MARNRTLNHLLAIVKRCETKYEATKAALEEAERDVAAARHTYNMAKGFRTQGLLGPDDQDGDEDATDQGPQQAALDPESLINRDLAGLDLNSLQGLSQKDAIRAIARMTGGKVHVHDLAHILSAAGVSSAPSHGMLVGLLTMTLQREEQKGFCSRGDNGEWKIDLAEKFA